jgi:hypothetical protein
MSVEDVLKSANGLTFYGSDAVKAGLADSVNTLQEAIAMTTAANQPSNTNTPAPAAAEAANAEAAAALAAERARAEKAEAELKAFKEKEAKAASDRAAAECKAAYKESFGREATAEEISAYQACDEAGRNVIKAALKESKVNRDKLIEKSGLTEEQVKGENNPQKASLMENGLVQAAVRLGFTETN